jgi:hypothetical protein
VSDVRDAAEVLFAARTGKPVKRARLRPASRPPPPRPAAPSPPAGPARPALVIESIEQDGAEWRVTARKPDGKRRWHWERTRALAVAWAEAQEKLPGRAP